MSYTNFSPLNDEQENILTKSSLCTQIMMGVYPTNKYVQKVKKKYQTPELLELPNKILEQDKKIITTSHISFEKNQEINSLLDETLLKVENNINLIETSLSNNEDKPSTEQIDLKEGEFKRNTENNDELIKKSQETIQDLERKKKENEEFLKKYEGEKKVWLDRLKEEFIQKDTYGKGFKYLYEAKTIKLILEGVFLVKIQDMIEKEMCKRGEVFGWNVMNQEKMDNLKKQQDFEFNAHLLNLKLEEQLTKEKEYKEKCEREDKKNEKLREDIAAEWKQLWNEIWIPDVIPSNDPDVVHKRDLMIKITMEVTFNVFKKMCFDTWKFKNMILNNKEYIILDKIRSYFPEKHVPGRTQDELCLNQLMNIIENIKAEEELIYCDLTPIKNKINEYSKNAGNSTAKERLEEIYNKIIEVQYKVNEDQGVLIKNDVVQIKKMINDIKYDGEKKLFKDNLINDKRLYDEFLPLTNTLMVVSFMTVSQKRNKNYQNRIQEAQKEISEMKGKNNEMLGKWDVLKEIKEKLGEEMGNDILNRSQEMANNEMFKSQKIIEDIRKSLNRVIELKNKQQMNSFNFFKKIRKVVVRPKDLC